MKRDSWLGAVPLMLLPLIAYNIAAFSFPGGFAAPNASADLAIPLFRLPMPSGVGWPVGLGDLLIVVSLVVLFVELLKSTASSRTVILNHGLSMVLFIAALIEFLLLDAFATSTFFLILLMILLDVLAGFIVTIMTARRDVEFAPGAR